MLILLFLIGVLLYYCHDYKVGLAFDVDCEKATTLRVTSRMKPKRSLNSGITTGSEIFLKKTPVLYDIYC